MMIDFTFTKAINPLYMKAIGRLPVRISPYTHVLMWVIALGGGTSLHSQTSSASDPATDSSAVAPYVVSEVDPNQRIWNKVTLSVDVNGREHLKTNSYTEIATGMLHPVGGKLVASTDQIQITATGGQATNAMQHARFLGNINSSGAIDITMPDGRHLTSNPLGISYFDTATGKSVMIAEIKDSYGQLLPTGNEAVFPDAFTDFRADVLYKTSVSGLEQFVILREQPPSPAEWSLDPSTTMLQVITEFVNPPVPALTPVPDDNGDDLRIDFGSMQMVKGAAFAIGGETNQIPVAKRWQVANGRVFLVEQVPLISIAPELEQLPEPVTGSAMLNRSRRSPAKDLNLPERRLALHVTPAFKAGRRAPVEKGFAMDYTLLASQTNLVLQSDTTYYVSGTVNVNGTLTIEGGTVVKFTNSPAATITSSNVVCKTARFRPAVFTSKDDNSLGQTIGGSTGSPAGFYGNVALDFSSTPSVPLLSNLRFTYLSNCLIGVNITLRDSQIVNCWNGLAAGAAQPTFQNVLAYKVKSVYPNSSPQTFVGINLTAHYCTNFFSNTGGAIYLSNSIFACVTNWQCTTTVTNYDALLTTDAGLFQTVGNASHYLASDSPYRNAGTANMISGLLADLQTKTTYPPLVYSPQMVSSDTAFFPQAQRDTDAVDLGYHYDPIDYAFSGILATNATVTINAGTVIGLYGTGPYTYGIGLAGNAKLTVTGTPTALVQMTASNTVQEPATTNWSSPTYALVTDVFTGADLGITCRFTDFSGLAQDIPYIYAANSGLVYLQDCQLHGGQLTSQNPSFLITNCLLERVYAELDMFDGNQSAFRNNLFWQGTIDFWPVVTNVIIADNLFDHSAVQNLGGLSYKGGFNAYVTNSTRLAPSMSTDIILPASPVYQSGPLGNYYLLSTSVLINADTNTTADKVGLYQYTVLTNLVGGLQIKETNSLVDVSFHYVATDALGTPIDSNGDGSADYLSDLNGNGKTDSGEVGWNILGDLGLKVIITHPTSSSKLP
jgi:hypothetical protein